MILRLFGALLDTAPTLGAGLDWKSSLQELTASRGMGAPAYVVTSTGPDHDKEFTATVVVIEHRVRQGRRAHQEGSRAEGGRRGVDRAFAQQRRCLSFPKSRSSGGGWQAHVTGKTITAVRVHHPRAVRRHEAGPADLTARLLDAHDHRHRPARQVPVADARRRLGTGRAPRDERADAARSGAQRETTCASRRCSTTAPR